MELVARREGKRAQREAAAAAKQRQKLEEIVAPMVVRFDIMVGSKPARWGMSNQQTIKGGEIYEGHDDPQCFRSLASVEQVDEPVFQSLGSSEQVDEPVLRSHDSSEKVDKPVLRSLGSSEKVDPHLYEHVQAAEMPPVSLPEGLHCAAAEPNTNASQPLFMPPPPQQQPPAHEEQPQQPQQGDAAAQAALEVQVADPSAKRTKREPWPETMEAAYATSGVSGALAAFDAHLATSDAAVAAQPSTYITASEVLHKCGVDSAVCADMLFNVLETKLPDTQVCRVVAYHLLSYGCFDDAVALLELVRETLAPAEPHSFTDLAFARFHRLRVKSSDCGGQTSAAHTRSEMWKVVADLTTVLTGTEWQDRFDEIEWPVLILLSWAVAWAEHKLAWAENKLVDLGGYAKEVLASMDVVCSGGLSLSLWPEEQLPAATYRLGGAAGPQLDVFVWLGWDTDNTVRFRPRPAPPHPAALIYTRPSIARVVPLLTRSHPLVNRRMWTCTSRSRQAKRSATRTIALPPPARTSRATSKKGTAPKSTRCRARPKACTMLRPTTSRRTSTRARPAPRRP